MGFAVWELLQESDSKEVVEWELRSGSRGMKVVE